MGYLWDTYGIPINPPVQCVCFFVDDVDANLIACRATLKRR